MEEFSDKMRKYDKPIRINEEIKTLLRKRKKSKKDTYADVIARMMEKEVRI